MIYFCICYGQILKNGCVDFMGTADDAVDYYIGNNVAQVCSFAEIVDAHRRYEFTTKELELLSVKLLGDPTECASNQPLEFEIKLRKNKKVDNASMEIMINNQKDERVGSYLSPYFDVRDIPVGKEFMWKSKVEHNLARGKYQVCFNVGLKNIEIGNKDFDIVHNVLAFSVVYADSKTQSAFSYWPDYNGSLYFPGESEVKL